MTVIAWDGETLAADRRLSFGHNVQPCCKLRRGRNGTLIGMVGDAGQSEYYAAWFDSLRADPELFNKDLMGEGGLLVIYPNKEIWYYDGTSPVGYRLTSEHAAAGSGMSAALVAMACGKTAIEAVELAARFNNTCGDGVDYLRFDEENKK
jgi:hypothetical protein